MNRIAGLGAALVLAAGIASAQSAEPVHGADAVFSGRGVVVLWAVLRGADEPRSQVVIRVVTRTPAVEALAVDGVDPFSNARVTRAEPSVLRGSLDIRVPRSTLAEHPRTELRFARRVADLVAGRPALTVYFTGVPDTAPEFPTESALAAYLDGALARTR